LCLFIGIIAVSQATDDNDGINSPSNKLKIQKLEVEIEKLQNEIRNIEITNKAMGPRTRWFSTVIGAIGGLAGAMIALTIWFLGRSAAKRYQEVQSSKDSQEKLKLKQDKELAREVHNLELFKALGSDEPLTSLAAASVLLQRLKQFHKNEQENNLTDTETLEQPTITQVLLSMLKKRDEYSESHLSLMKLIADSMVEYLGAIMPGPQKDAKAEPLTEKSPLKRFDFQKTHLSNLWWKLVDAREVDFFDSEIKDAGFAKALLAGAIFLESDLTGSVFKEADLDNANLRNTNLDKTVLKGANLCNADLSGAKNIGNAQLFNAKYNHNTKWPEGFDPKEANAVLIET
jgi:hypothetical protein